MKAMRANIGMCKASPLVLAALSVAVAGCSGNNNSPATSGSLPASTFSAASTIQSSSSIIALDPVNQAIWVPSYTLDAKGNLQYELISTAAAVAGGTATVSKKVSMTGCDTPIGIAFAGSGASSGNLLVECGNSTSLNLYLSAVDASSLAVTPIATPGLTWTGNGIGALGGGGIIVDPQHSQAFIAGSTNFGLLQVPAGGAPSFEANSVTAMPPDPNIGAPDIVESMAMDFNLQQVVITNLVINDQPPYELYTETPPQQSPPYVVETGIVNTSAPALNITQLPPIGVVVQGGAFDSATGVLALAGYLGGYRGFNGFFTNDVVGVLNMETYNASGPSVDSVLVNGFLDYYIGQFTNYNDTTLNFAGGVAALNPTTHQVLVGDAWGPNLLLMQLPSTVLGPNGNLDNNGQPSTSGVPSLTAPDATSTYAIAQTLVSPQTVGQAIPSIVLNGVEVVGQSPQFNVLGAPPALVIDQANNIAYVLADNSTASHPWAANTGLMLALVSLDLSAPVPGACPNQNSVICAATWNPSTAQVVVP